MDPFTRAHLLLSYHLIYLYYVPRYFLAFSPISGEGVCPPASQLFGIACTAFKGKSMVFTIDGHLKLRLRVIVLVSGGNSEHVAHACWKTGLFGERIRLFTTLNLIKCLKINRSNNRYCSLRVHLLSNYHLILIN